MALKMDHTGAGDITLDSTQAGELRVDGTPVFFADTTGVSTGDILYYNGSSWVDSNGDFFLQPGLGGTQLSILRHDFSDSSGAGYWQIRKSDAQTLNMEYQDDVGTIKWTHRFDASENMVWISQAAGNVLTLAQTTGYATFSGKLLTSSSTTSRAGFYLPSGTPPTAPADGDIWATGGGARQLYMRMDGVTYSFARLEVANTWTGKQTFPATTTGAASVTLPHGTAPTTPTNGDLWTTTAGLYARINGSTVGPFGTSAVTAFNDLSDVDLTGAANNDLLFRSGGNWIDSGGALTWNTSIFSVSGEIELINTAPAITHYADATAAARRIWQTANWDGVSAYDDIARTVFSNATGSATTQRMEVYTGSVWQVVQILDPDGGAANRLSFPDGFQADASDFSGNVSITGILNVSNYIGDTTDTGNLSLFGGTGTGANIELYGSTHATLADNAYYDAAQHQFRDVDASPTILTLVPNIATFACEIRLDTANDLIYLNYDYATGLSTAQIQMRGDNVTQGAGTNQRFNLGLDSSGNAIINNTFSTGGTHNLTFQTGSSTRLLLDNTQAEFSVPIEAQGGSAAAPGVAFSGDPTTGLYRSAANNIDITVGGSQMVNISNGTSTGLLTWTGSVLTVDRNANATSGIHIGETATLRGNSQQAYLRLYGEQTSTITYGGFNYDGTNLSAITSGSGEFRVDGWDLRVRTGGLFYINTDDDAAAAIKIDPPSTTAGTTIITATGSSYWEGTMYFRTGSAVRMYDSGNTQYVGMDHNGTNGLIRCVGGDLDIGVGGTAAVTFRYNNQEQGGTQDESANGVSSGMRLRHRTDTFYDVGFNVAPHITQDASFSAAATWGDAQGLTILHTSATAHTYTTPANTDTSLASGAMWQIVNIGTGNVTIAAGTSVTLTWQDGAGGTTGSRTLAQGGVASLWRRSATLWYVWGTGLT